MGFKLHATMQSQVEGYAGMRKQVGQAIIVVCAKRIASRSVRATIVLVSTATPNPSYR
jgi:hypothetical protein